MSFDAAVAASQFAPSNTWPLGSFDLSAIPSWKRDSQGGRLCPDRLLCCGRISFHFALLGWNRSADWLWSSPNRSEMDNYSLFKVKFSIPDLNFWWTLLLCLPFQSLTVLSIATQVQIYRKARSCLRRDLTHHLFNHQPNRINRLELEATVTLVCGVMSLSFFSLPYSTFSMGDWICKLNEVAVLRHQKWCNAVQFSLPYARELFLVHSVYNPIMYMIRSREFSDALRSIVPCHRKE